MRSPAVCSAALLALAACGGDPPPPPGAETGAYRMWAGRRTEIPSGGLAETIRGSLQILPPPADRIKRPDDFWEVWLNGKRLHRLKLAPLPDGSFPSFEIALDLRTGPNWIDLWDSTTNRGERETIDTRQGTELLFSPTDEGYGFTQTKRE